MRVIRVSLLSVAVLMTVSAGALWAGVVVDCDSGGSINDALAAAAGDPEVFIDFSGFCDEKVVISRANVTLTGVGDARVRAPEGVDGAMHVHHAQNVTLENFSVRSGDIYGLRISHSNAVVATDVSARNNDFWGMIIISSQATLRGCTVQENAGSDFTVGGGINAIDSRISTIGCVVADNPVGGAEPGTRRTAVQALSGTTFRFINGNAVAEVDEAPEAEGDSAFYVDESSYVFVRTARLGGDVYVDDESRIEFFNSTEDSETSLSVNGSSSVRCENTSLTNQALDEFSVGYFSNCGVVSVDCTIGSEAQCEGGGGNGGSSDCCNIP